MFLVGTMFDVRLITVGVAAGITASLVGLAVFWQAEPKTYEDCLLMVAKSAQTDNSANIGKIACWGKFIEPQAPVTK